MVFVIAFTTWAWSAYAGCNAGLATQVADVNVEQQSVFAALLQFGSDTGVCFALEAPGLDLLKRAASVHASRPAVAYVIQSLLTGGPYQVSESHGVILVRNADSIRQTTQLDTAVLEYTIPRMSVTRAIFGLRARLKRLADPSIQTLLGTYSDRFPDDQEGPMDEHGRTVRDLLTMIVGQSRGGAWISGQCSGQSNATQAPCWNLVSYHEEPETLVAMIANLTNKLAVERTPQK